MTKTLKLVEKAREKAKRADIGHVQTEKEALLAGLLHNPKVVKLLSEASERLVKNGAVGPDILPPQKVEMMANQPKIKNMQKSIER